MVHKEYDAMFYFNGLDGKQKVNIVNKKQETAAVLMSELLNFADEVRVRRKTKAERARLIRESKLKLDW